MSLYHFYMLLHWVFGPSLVEIAAIIFGMYMAVYVIVMLVQAFSTKRGA